MSKPRNPKRMREHLLQTAFQQIYKSGFQGTGIDTILDAAGVTKGALYHYFDGKEALGYAVVEEIIAVIVREKWLRPLQNEDNPIDALCRIIRSTPLHPEAVNGGCPLNNLAQEMSPLDKGFRERLARVFDDWRNGIATALRDGQKNGSVRSDIGASETATLLIAAYEGYISLAKSSQDARTLQSGKKMLVRYLKTLRTGDQSTPKRVQS